MRWRKLGKVFCAGGEQPWMYSHAANPVPLSLGNGAYRIFFNSRAEDNRSYVGFIDIDLAQPGKIISVSQRPALEPGLPGYFDDSGVSLGGIVEHAGVRLLYYVGWNLGTLTPFRNTIGVAALEPGEAVFRKLRQAPVIDRSEADPFNISYPCVLEESGDLRMWYGSNLEAAASVEEMNHAIKYAESADGFVWKRDGAVILGPRNRDDVGPCRPAVLRDGGSFLMMYCTRPRLGPYRLEEARSVDGVEWERTGAPVELKGVQEEWDGEMQCYPALFVEAGVPYLLYAGNGYGRAGFGLAVAE